MVNNAYNKAACFYAGRRINFHLFIHYQQRFRQKDFFSTFVRNLNFNNFNWAEGLDWTSNEYQHSSKP
jgi:hypothetical protein